MSFTIKKRLARKQIPVNQPMKNISPKTIDKKPLSTHRDLFVMPYTDKSFVVTGDTINHTRALVELGGKYNAQLRIGQGWIFAKPRQNSVEKYIATGEIEPFVYSTTTYERKNNTEEVRQIFKEFRGAFDDDKDYVGSSIIEVISKLEEKYLNIDKSEKKDKSDSEKDIKSDSEKDIKSESDDESSMLTYKRLARQIS
jgi:hypothetical protein